MILPSRKRKKPLPRSRNSVRSADGPRTRRPVRRRRPPMRPGRRRSIRFSTRDHASGNAAKNASFPAVIAAFPTSGSPTPPAGSPRHQQSIPQRHRRRTAERHRSIFVEVLSIPSFFITAISFKLLALSQTFRLKAYGLRLTA